ncbi:hypothetical protein K438DRAFT_1997099 [Mycena galopus ATCC 62051]|nr:hypothetical protein K438DRAFT_1997099 [Mycena galopus ATCC 62051]
MFILDEVMEDNLEDEGDNCKCDGDKDCGRSDNNHGRDNDKPARKTKVFLPESSDEEIEDNLGDKDNNRKRDGDNDPAAATTTAGTMTTGMARKTTVGAATTTGGAARKTTASAATTAVGAGCPDWEQNTASGTSDFMECYKFLKADNLSRFKEIGPLLAFLLAADLSYSGAVAAPDVSTVGWIVQDMNKGAMTGLEQLELIPMRRSGSKNKPGKGNIGEVKAGFLSLYQFLDAKLSDVSKTHMGFDPIMVENILCKWAQWVRLNLVSLVL